MSGVIAYLYYKQQIFSYNNNLLYQMREYNFNFKGKKFDATIIDNISSKKIDVLYIVFQSPSSAQLVKKKKNELT